MIKCLRYKYNTSEHRSNTSSIIQKLLKVLLTREKTFVEVSCGKHSHFLHVYCFICSDLTCALSVDVCECACSCVSRIDTCVFPINCSMIPRALISCFVPVHFPLLSVHLFLLWWLCCRPAWAGHGFNWDTRWTLTFPSVCLFPVSFRFRESVCKQESTESESLE